MYYAVQVQTGKEKHIINLINERVDSRLVNDAFAPRRIVARKRNGVLYEVEQAIFPGYIFVDTDNPKELGHALIYHIPDFARLLGRESSSGDFVALSELETKMIDMLCDRNNNHLVGLSDITVSEGKVVTVVSGPLFGITGVVKRIDLHKRIAEVEISLCGRSNIVKLGLNIINEKQN